MSNPSATIRLVAGATVLLIALGAARCGSSSDGSKGDGTATGGACRQPGPLTKDLLPTFGADETKTVQNPCLGFVDLLSQVTDLIPTGERRLVTDFTEGVGEIAKKVAKIGDLVECGYEKDRLAIAIYQNHQTVWSIGVVAVVRGDLQAAVDTSLCYLRKQLPLSIPTETYLGGPEGPTPTFCFDTVRRTRNAENYTVLWLGSSDFMCLDLNSQLNTGSSTGDGISATVKAVPDVAIRSGPSTKTAIVGRAGTGAVGNVTCYSKGETVTGRRGTSDRWDQTKINGMTGFIADVWLDTGGDVAAKIKPCQSG